MTGVLKPLSIGKAVRDGFEGFKNNALFFILALLLIFLFFIGYHYLSETLQVKGSDGTYHSKKPLLSFLLAFVHLIFVLFYTLGLFRISLGVIRGKKPEIADFLSSPRDLWNFFVGYVLFVLSVIAGLILLIFPGIIWGVKFSMFPFFVADQGVSGVDALKLSSQATYGAKWDLLGYFLIYILFKLGAILSIFGLLIVIPVGLMAQASLYNSLTKD